MKKRHDYKEQMMDSTEGISVIIPAYNAEQTIENCIRSICYQTYRNLQIICVNDGSKDRTKDVLLKLQNEDARIQVIIQKNSGAASARNNGIRHATKKYIAFVDADDTIDLTMYEAMLSFMQENHLECVCCDCLNHTYDGKEIYTGTSVPEDIINGREKILEYVIKPVLGFNNHPKEPFKVLWNKLFLRSLITEKNIWVDEGRIHGEDREFCLNYYRYITNFGFVRKPLYHYMNMSKTSLSTRVRMNYLESILDDQIRFRDWYPELEWNSPKKEAELLSLPLRTAKYYRENLRKEQARQMLDSVYTLCTENLYWRQAAEESPVWKSLMQDKTKFDDYIWKKSTKDIMIPKIKKNLKAILRKN